MQKKLDKLLIYKINIFNIKRNSIKCKNSIIIEY